MQYVYVIHYYTYCMMAIFYDGQLLDVQYKNRRTYNGCKARLMTAISSAILKVPRRTSETQGASCSFLSFRNVPAGLLRLQCGRTAQLRQLVQVDCRCVVKQSWGFDSEQQAVAFVGFLRRISLQPWTVCGQMTLLLHSQAHCLDGSENREFVLHVHTILCKSLGPPFDLLF